MVLDRLFSRNKSTITLTDPDSRPAAGDSVRSPSQSPEKHSRRHRASFQEERLKHSYSYPNSTPHKSRPSRKKNKPEHPLNLHPDELYQLSLEKLEQYSPMGSQTEENGTDVPSSPVNGTTTPKTNGVNGEKHEGAPQPPPHKEAKQESSPEEAEAFKAAGNKFFKAQEWRKAIDEYTKGKIISE